MNRPTHFEMPVDDADRAEKFYTDVFGWKFQRFEGAPQYYGLATTGDADAGINGALFQRGQETTTSITMLVDSIEDATEKVKSAGGKVLQDKMPIPGVGYFATCEDTEGNHFGVYKDDPSATM